jgi:hypothetical protein
LFSAAHDFYRVQYLPYQQFIVSQTKYICEFYLDLGEDRKGIPKYDRQAETSNSFFFFFFFSPAGTECLKTMAASLGQRRERTVLSF